MLSNCGDCVYVCVCVWVSVCVCVCVSFYVCMCTSSEDLQTLICSSNCLMIMNTLFFTHLSLLGYHTEPSQLFATLSHLWRLPMFYWSSQQTFNFGLSVKIVGISIYFDYLFYIEPSNLGQLFYLFFLFSSCTAWTIY